MTPRRLPLALACAALSLASASGTPLLAQTAADGEPPCRVRGSRQWLSTRASPLDSASLTVGARVAKICYSRPSARGRVVYETLAPFGRAWRTGANEPTILELTAAAEVAGVPLAPGRYAILTVPGPTEWVVAFHTFEESDDASRIFATLVEDGIGRARAEPLEDPVETFVIRPVHEPSGAAFLLEWGTLRVHVPVRFHE